MWSIFGGHERVIVGNEPESGLRAIVAIHSTTLGPGLGGTRLINYPNEDAALADALKLSRAMTYKNALARIPHGGGKGVIWADPSAKSPDLLHAYGRLVASQRGDYITACDVGTYVTDMDVIAEVCPWTTGRSPANGGAGDSGILTAFGVWQSMRATAAYRWGSAELTGRKVGIAGLGKVGRRLAAHLADEGANVIAFEPNDAARDAARDELPTLNTVASHAELVAAELDVYSPNALGGAIDKDLASTLNAAIICGGANNQLADPGLARTLADRDVLYAPDFMVNCGGVVQVAYEVPDSPLTLGRGFDHEAARAHVAGVFDTTMAVLDRARSAGITPVEAAEAEAAEIIQAGRYA